MTKVVKKQTENIYSTRHEEVRFRTSNLDEAKGMFTAERIFRTWKEDFVDEDSMEVVSIDRKEIILDRGVVLDSEALSILNFHIQSGDIKEIEVTNQRRAGMFGDFATSIWQVTILVNAKKKNFFLYANTINQAIEIIKDFAEQAYDCFLSVVQAKVFDNVILITDIYEDESEELENQYNEDSEPKDPEAYRIELDVSSDGFTENLEFIVKAQNAEQAKTFIERYLSVKYKKENRDSEFTTTLISAKSINCEQMIDLEFCIKYIQEENAEQYF